MVLEIPYTKADEEDFAKVTKWRERKSAAGTVKFGTYTENGRIYFVTKIETA